jgi:hypothetical protein
MTLHVTTRGKRHGDCRQDHRQQRGEAEELLRPIERGADLWPTVLRVFYPLPAPQLWFDLTLEALDQRQLAGQQQAVGDTAADLQQGRCRQIVEVHQQARRDAEEIDAAIGLQGQHGVDAQRALPDGNPVTDTRAQRRRQTLVDPGRARSGHAARRRIGNIERRGDAQAPRRG